METPDLESLLRGGFNEADRRLLESAKGDAARPGARDEMLAALGVQGVAAPERFFVRLGRRFGGSGGSLLHGIVMVAFVGAAAGGTVLIRNSSERTSELAVSGDAPAGSPLELAVVGDAPASSPGMPFPLPSSPLPAEGTVRTDAERESAPVVALDSLPNAPSAASAASAAPEKASAVSRTIPPADTLGREIARVEAARAALARDDVKRALSILEAYEREFSPGAFATEVSVLRIDALARVGQTEQARRLGARFLSEHPQDAFARRVATTLAALPAVPPSSAERAQRSPDE